MIDVRDLSFVYPAAAEAAVRSISFHDEKGSLCSLRINA